MTQKEIKSCIVDDKYLVKKIKNGSYRVFNIDRGDIVADFPVFPILDPSSKIEVIEFEDYEEVNKIKCLCDIIVLLNNGCKCGAIEKERTFK